MIVDETRKQLQDIVRGALIEGQGDHCKTVRNLLIESFGASTTAKSEFESRTILKEKQAHYLKSYAEKNALWLRALPDGTAFIARGGEAQVYLAPDALNVIKVNDAVYYATAPLIHF